VSGQDESASRPEGLAGSMRAAGATAMSLLRLRLELAAIELKEGAEQRRQLLVLGSIAAVFLAVSLLLLAVLVVVFFWDTHRMSAICGVTLVYAGIGTWAYLRFRETIRQMPPPFSVTLAEFQKDLDLLRGNDEPE
jgi:uncharacterized membrane protein YqjE